MQPFQQRVVDEKVALDEKLTALEQFMDTSIFKGLPFEEVERMKRQAEAMTEYSLVLGERIAAF